VSETAAPSATATAEASSTAALPSVAPYQPFPPAPPEVLDARFGVPLGTVGSRITWFVLAALPATVIGTARALTPNPLGHGTHTQLGLPPCGFLMVTGFPCPGCGLTTSFANMADFHFIDAARANAFGVLLFLVSFATIPVALAGLVRGWAVVPLLERMHIEKWALVMALVSMTVWVTRCVTMWLW